MYEYLTLRVFWYFILKDMKHILSFEFYEACQNDYFVVSDVSLAQYVWVNMLHIEQRSEFKPIFQYHETQLILFC